MSTLLILCSLLFVVMCLAYLNLRSQQPKSSLREVPQFKKDVDYQASVQVLSEMAREKEIQMQRRSKLKVSVHLSRDCASI